MSSQLYTNTSGRLAVVMVGLPGTGKTFTARNLSRYLRWLGVRTRTFSVAAYRRSHMLAHGDIVSATADFFDPNSGRCLRVRTEIADAALDDLIAWLGCGDVASVDGGGQVAILDASNTTSARRDTIEARLSENKVQCVFLECISDNQSEHFEGHMEELLLTCPEYAGWPTDRAHTDYLLRIQHYRVNYQPLTSNPPKCGFLQLVNGGEQLIVERVNGFLCSRMTYYLMNLRQSSTKRAIYLLPITDGVTTSDYIHSVCKSIVRMCSGEVQVWTPTAPAYVAFRMMPRLRAIEPGNPPTPTLPPLPTPQPTTFDTQPDPYFARNPQGESYHDLAIRLEPVIMELEGGQGVTVIAADPFVLRCISGYFCEVGRRQLVGMQVEVGRVIGLRPRAYGCFEQLYDVGGGLGLEKSGIETLRLYNDNIASPK